MSYNYNNGDLKADSMGAAENDILEDKINKCFDVLKEFVQGQVEDGANDGPNYQCEKCGAQFYSKEDYISHMKKCRGGQ